MLSSPLAADGVALGVLVTTARVLPERHRELTVASSPWHPTRGHASPEALPKPRSLRELRLTSVEIEHTSSGLIGVGNGRYATVLGRRATIAASELAPVTQTPTFTTLRCGLTRGVRGWSRFRQPAYRRRALPVSPSSSLCLAAEWAQASAPSAWFQQSGPSRALG
jgi:hypothetical protein